MITLFGARPQVQRGALRAGVMHTFTMSWEGKEVKWKEHYLTSRTSLGLLNQFNNV